MTLEDREKYIDMRFRGGKDNSIWHETDIMHSRKCGCFFCMRIFLPSEIKNWCDEDHQERTAICSYCGIDAVLGDGSGIEITEDLLKANHDRSFSRSE